VERNKENLTRSWKAEFETREAEDGKKTISGYFAVFNSEQNCGRGLMKKLRRKRLIAP
jgi:phage head maturation protease